MHWLVLWLMVVVSLGFATGDAAGQSKCEGHKLLASGQRADADLHCQSKDAKDGVAIDPACQAKAEKKFLAAWVKAEARADCSDPGDLALRDEIIERYLEVFPNRLRQFQDANACVAAKLRAAADAASDKFACVGKVVTKGTGLDLACFDKADDKLLTAFGTAEAKSLCLTLGDGDDINHLVTEFVDCSLGPNEGSCGSILTPIAIDVAPGSLFGYIPLDAFGVASFPIGDEEISNFIVGTPFVYNNVRYSSIGISPNGYVIAGGGEADDNAFVPQTLPDGGRPNNVLAPFWTDLDGTGAPGIFVANVMATGGTDNWIVVEWRVNAFGTNDLKVFQIWIGTNGVQDITFAYDLANLPNANGLSQAVTVGAENADGTVGGQISGLPTQGLRVTSTLGL